LELLVSAGLSVEETRQAATLDGWEACSRERTGRKFSVLAEGCAADITRLKGEAGGDIGALRQVDFVMKDGELWKTDGKAVGML